jgi:hypothetical protein
VTYTVRQLTDMAAAHLAAAAFLDGIHGTETGVSLAWMRYKLAYATEAGDEDTRRIYEQMLREWSADPLGQQYGRETDGSLRPPTVWPEDVPITDWIPSDTVLGNLVSARGLVEAATARQTELVVASGEAKVEQAVITHPSRIMSDTSMVPDPQGVPRLAETGPHHFGPDPVHGGLTKHLGLREYCSGPDCGMPAAQGDAQP